MTRWLLVVALMIILPVTNVQGKSDLHSRNYIKNLSIEKNEENRYVSAIIKITEDSVIDDLTKLGVKLINRRRELLLVYIPISKIEHVSDMMAISRVGIGTQSLPLMDKARVMGNVDDIISAQSQIGIYDGSGVVVGFSDIGFDPNHISFLDENNNRRVKRLVNYVDSLGLIVDITDSNEISRWITDRSEEFHATHVGGILAGSYCGNGYEGIATGAEIVATTSELYDGSILAGVENVVEYARQQGKPAVVNLSVGSYTGPHDGSDLFCQYLDRIGEDAIICISAGNEGTKQNTLSKQFKENDVSLKTMISNRAWDLIHIKGNSDFWSADSSDFQAKICIYDCLEKKMIFESPFVGKCSGVDEWGIASADIAQPDDVTDELFDSCFTGYLRLYAQLDAENNRYTVLFSYDVLNHKYNQKWGRYCPGIIISAQPGMRIDGYADGSNSCFRSMGVARFENGNSQCSISNIACGNNVIVVGMSNSRNKVPIINGGELTYDFAEGTVSEHSSYGTLIDGRHLPHICAPGNMVVSSVSGAFVNRQNEDFKSQLTTILNANGRDNHWWAASGTSMSSPFVAGVYALWLQADATLTVDEIKEITISTANKSAVDILDPRWSNGNIDAMAGLREVLSRNNLDNVAVKNGAVSVNTSGNICHISSIGCTIDKISLYTIQGIEVMSTIVNGEYVCFDVSKWNNGVYLMYISCGGYHHIERIVVR